MTEELKAFQGATLNDLVTSVKLKGSACALDGFTTPEDWPFTVIVTVGSPGNEAALELARRFGEEMMKLGAPVTELHRAKP